MKNQLVSSFIFTAILSANIAEAIDYKPDPSADSKKTLLLKDFKPKSNLHAKIHLVKKAKYYVVDVHSHINDAMGIQDHQDPKKVLQIMKDTNVKTVVILTGLWGDKLQKVIDEMVKPYPGKFIVFTQIDLTQFDQPDFAKNAVEQIRDSVKRGAKGLKFLKDFGLGAKDKDGKLITIDSPKFDPIWAECANLGIPVGIHTGDPEAFFDPISATNERYEELIENPDWSFSDQKKFPTFENLMKSLDKVYAKHPKTTFIALHMGWPENLDYLDKILSTRKNVMLEFGARVAELGRQPYRSKEFFEKFQDRIMFGSDNDLVEDMYRVSFRWLETKDEYFDYWEAPAQGRWKIYGMGLSDQILKKVYHENAEKMFGIK